MISEINMLQKNSLINFKIKVFQFFVVENYKNFSKE